MATGTLTISTDLMNSWLLKRLRPTSSPLVRGGEATASDSFSNVEKVQVNNQLTVDQEIKVLAHAANELRKAYSDVISGLNNVHGRKMQELNEPFTQRLSALIKALQDDDMDLAKDAAKRLMLLINEMQTNIPAWDFVRALQLLADRCKSLS
jgi:CRISPR/Cas system CSM-associated protein Csm2 small subunit